MNGCVIKGTPIAIDFWKTRECPSAKIFFLTHLHGDHVVGLTSSWQRYIYCSEVTAQLLRINYGIREALIKPLAIGQSHIIYLDEVGHEQMTVTPVDANHCPGAVMFLFEGYFGKILYTGDFRNHDNLLDNIPVDLTNIEDLYLDNTYCDPSCIFPSADAALDQIISIIKDHPQHDILIGVRNLGKEKLLLKIATDFKEWVSIPVNMSYTVDALGFPDVFMVDDKACRIRAVPFHSVTQKYINKLKKATIAILPTSLYSGIDLEPYCNSDTIFVVNYSDHSSYSELLDFVKLLAPKRVIPIVNGNTKGPFGISFQNRADMSCFSKFLSGEIRKSFNIPETVRKFMSTRLESVNSKPIRKGMKRKRPFCMSRGSSKSYPKGVQFDYEGSDDNESETIENNPPDRMTSSGKSDTLANNTDLVDCTECTCFNNMSVGKGDNPNMSTLKSSTSYKKMEEKSKYWPLFEVSNKCVRKENMTNSAKGCEIIKNKQIVRDNSNQSKTVIENTNILQTKSVSLLDVRDSGRETDIRQTFSHLNARESLGHKPLLHQMDADSLIENENEPQEQLLRRVDSDCFILVNGDIAQEHLLHQIDVGRPKEGMSSSHKAVVHQMGTNSLGKIVYHVHKPLFHQMDADNLIEELTDRAQGRQGRGGWEEGYIEVGGGREEAKLGMDTTGEVEEGRDEAKLGMETGEVEGGREEAKLGMETGEVEGGREEAKLGMETGEVEGGREEAKLGMETGEVEKGMEEAILGMETGEVGGGREEAKLGMETREVEGGREEAKLGMETGEVGGWREEAKLGMETGEMGGGREEAKLGMETGEVEGGWEEAKLGMEKGEVDGREGQEGSGRDAGENGIEWERVRMGQEMGPPVCPLIEDETNICSIEKCSSITANAKCTKSDATDELNISGMHKSLVACDNASNFKYNCDIEDRTHSKTVTNNTQRIQDQNIVKSKGCECTGESLQEVSESNSNMDNLLNSTENDGLVSSESCDFMYKKPKNVQSSFKITPLTFKKDVSTQRQKFFQSFNKFLFR